MKDSQETARKAAVLLAKHAAKKLGDKMAASKRPFWRRVVSFFRRSKSDG